MSDPYHTLIAAAVKAKAMSSTAASIGILMTSEGIMIEGVAVVRHGGSPMTYERAFIVLHRDFIERPERLSETIDDVMKHLTDTFRETPKAVR